MPFDALRSAEPAASFCSWHLRLPPIPSIVRPDLALDVNEGGLRRLRCQMPVATVFFTSAHFPSFDLQFCPLR